MSAKKREIVFCWMAWIVSFVVIIAHFYWARESSVDNFQRGGAIMVIVAIILLSSSQWVSARGQDFADRPIGGYNHPLRIFEYFVSAPLLAGFGTIIWGYGDIIMQLFI